MEIIVKYFDQEIREQVRVFLENLVHELAHNTPNKLKLDALEYIIIAEDFGDEVVNFQRERNLKEGYTNDSFGRAYGKNICYKSEDNKLKTSVILDGSLVSNLFLDDEKDLRQQAIHLIHHELCHSHDENLKSEMMGVEAVLKDRGNLEELSKIHADSIWSEYIANRYSSYTMPGNHDLYAPYLIKMIAEIKDLNDNFISKYREHGDINQLFGEIQIHTAKLLYYTGTVLGYIHGHEWKETKAKQIIDKTIAETYFAEMWNKIEKELSYLHEIYGSWEGYDQFKTLGDCVLQMWNLMGVFPEELDDGRFYIGVPRTDY